MHEISVESKKLLLFPLMHNDPSDLGILILNQTTPKMAKNRNTCNVWHMRATWFKPLHGQWVLWNCKCGTSNKEALLPATLKKLCRKPRVITKMWNNKSNNNLNTLYYCNKMQCRLANITLENLYQMVFVKYPKVKFQRPAETDLFLFKIYFILLNLKVSLMTCIFTVVFLLTFS